MLRAREHGSSCGFDVIDRLLEVATETRRIALVSFTTNITKTNA